MKGIRLPILFWVIIILMMCVSSGCNRENPLKKLAGHYLGTYSGDYSGTWTAEISENGSIWVTVMEPNAGELVGQGTINRQGEFKLTTKGAGMDTDFANKMFFTWTGKFKISATDCIGKGTWSTLSNDSGTWEGKRSRQKYTM
jgi:hypothetical protein